MELEILLIKIAVELIIKKIKIDSKTLNYILLYLYLEEIDQTSKNKKKTINKIKDSSTYKIDSKEHSKNTEVDNTNIKKHYKKSRILNDDDYKKNYRNSYEVKPDYNSVDLSKIQVCDSASIEGYKKDDVVLKKSQDDKSVKKVEVRLANTIINDLVVANVEFNFPVLKILSASSELFILNSNCVKSNKNNKGTLIYEGILSITIKYLKPKDIIKHGFLCESGYYVIYMPLEGAKEVELEFNPFTNNKTVIKDIKMIISKYTENILTEFVHCSQENGIFKSKYKFVNSFNYNVEILEEKKVLM
ncbi:hypothetical protein [Clostridium senegalense]|uniref:DUF3794 domain-containing protein n=1 Tax=Clostridium senegalense TaxID=1465809 RepID=A0A6M0H5P4_9CLOT|nr:hypothetical protein [Clostridium senegalense]NEU04922.1 hypothetical protein [Clostridium senegalense]